MFANSDSLHMPADVRAALPVLFRQAAEIGLGQVVQPLDIIEGSGPAAAVRIPA
jgi:hypothetical protein